MDYVWGSAAVLAGGVVGYLVFQYVIANTSLNIKALGSLITIVLGGGFVYATSLAGAPTWSLAFYLIGVGLFFLARGVIWYGELALAREAEKVTASQATAASSPDSNH
jgi:hypothetical protein